MNQHNDSDESVGSRSRKKLQLDHRNRAMKHSYSEDGRKKKKKHYKRALDMSSEEEERRSRKRKTKAKKRSKGKRKKRRTKDDMRSDGSTSSYDTDSSSDSDIKRSRKKQKQKQRRKKSSRKGEIDECTVPPFVRSICTLFQKYPQFSTELPYLLIKLGNQECLDLSQMSPPDLGASLGNVFGSLGCVKDDKRGWEWKGATDIFDELLHFDVSISSKSGEKRSRSLKLDRELVLIKMVERILNATGITMEAINAMSDQQIRSRESVESIRKSPGSNEDTLETVQTREIETLTSMLLGSFERKEGDKISLSEVSLAKELFDLARMVIDEDESICLEGIEDENLKVALDKLFSATGLVKGVIDIEDDNESNEGEDIRNTEDSEPMLGYSLPEDKDTEEYVSAHSKLEALMKICRAHQQELVRLRSGKRMLGPSIPSSHDDERKQPSCTYHSDDPSAEDSGEDDGPLPVGDQRARKSNARRITVKPATAITDTAKTNGREEWMTTPGEHDFLKGVISSSGLKSRKFKNEKTGDKVPGNKASMNPHIQKQIDNAVQAHDESRGISLMDQHRATIAKKKAESINGVRAKWKWNRENDLDHGRRVDKQYLNMVMGGAGKELKNKFEGGYSKG